MTAYQPSCPACRGNDRSTFYKACAGCQVRRNQAWTAYHERKADEMPKPSVNGPPKETA